MASFKLKLVGDDEGQSGSWIYHSLLWGSIILVLSLLAFIVVGPLFNDPTIDDTIALWREKYFWIVAAVTIALVWMALVWFNWKDYRETGEIFYLFRIVTYAALVIVGTVVLSLGF